jgi:hypothetical protein
MFKLTEKRFADYFKNHPETGMGYWVADAHLKDGRDFRQVVIDSGFVTKVKGHESIPFAESDVDHFVVSHEKW